MKKPTHKLIETDELVKAAKLDRFGGYGTAKILMTLLRINKLNKLYDDAFEKVGVEFMAVTAFLYLLSLSNILRVKFGITGIKSATVSLAMMFAIPLLILFFVIVSGFIVGAT